MILPPPVPLIAPGAFGSYYDVTNDDIRKKLGIGDRYRSSLIWYSDIKDEKDYDKLKKSLYRHDLVS